MSKPTPSAISKYSLILLLLIFSIHSEMACSSHKCANFDDPNRNPHVKYSRRGLVKKHKPSKPFWKFWH